MEEKLRKANRLRVRCLVAMVISIILAAVFGAGGFAGMTVSMILHFDPEYLKYLTLALCAFSFLVVMTFFILVALKQPSRYKRHFYAVFAPEAVGNTYERFAYSNDKRKADALCGRAGKLLKRSPDVENVSYYEGTYGGVGFSSFAYECTGLKARHFGALAKAEEMERKGKISGHGSTGTASLSGRFFLLEFQDDPKVSLYLRDKRNLAAFKRPEKDYRRFEGESTLFGRYYECLYRGDIQAAYEAIGPSFLSRVLALEEDYGGYLTLFSEGKSVLCYFEKYDSGLGLGLARKATENTLRYLREELMLPKLLIKAVL